MHASLFSEYFALIFAQIKKLFKNCNCPLSFCEMFDISRPGQLRVYPLIMPPMSPRPKNHVGAALISYAALLLVQNSSLSLAPVHLHLAYLPDWVCAIVSFSVPHLWLLACANTLAYALCIEGVFSLTTQCTSLTVTLLITLRKFLSLLISIYYFEHPFTGAHVLGTLFVFAGVPGANTTHTTHSLCITFNSFTPCSLILYALCDSLTSHLFSASITPFAHVPHYLHSFS